MDIDRARTFLEIVHTGSFLKAADRLNVTQTTVSARVRTLEDELGRRLFERNRSGATLTPAGREFERFAQSFVQIWERARRQLSMPEGRTSIVAVGSELSLWDPLLLDWLIWMKLHEQQIAIHANVGMPDQLVEQLRTGVLDIAVLYDPKLLPGFKVQLIEEELLLLVRTPSSQAGSPLDYVHVDWGPRFGPDALNPTFGDPGIMVGLGPLALSYILRVGGAGYFRRGVIKPYLDANQLELVVGAPQFTYPAYAVYSETSEARVDIQAALQGFGEVVTRPEKSAP